MALIHAANGIGHFLVFLVCFYAFCKLSKKSEDISKIGKIIGAAGIFYGLMSFLNFMWLFGSFSPNGADFLLLNTIVTVANAFLATYLIFKITLSRNVVYMMILYITALFAANFSLKAFLLASSGISYLLLTIVFVELAFRSKGHMRKAGDIGILYCASSVLASILYFFERPHQSLWFVPAMIMGLVYLHIFRAIKEDGLSSLGKKQKIESGFEYAKVLFRFMIFMVCITAFVLVSTISIHELGHAFVAQFYGCSQYKAVIYDIINPHTEIACDGYYNDIAITLAGLFATFAIALVFLLTGAELINGISHLMAGFGLMIAYGDLIHLGASSNIAIPAMALSFIIIVISIVKISTQYLKQQEIFKEEK